MKKTDLQIYKLALLNFQVLPAVSLRSYKLNFQTFHVQPNLENPQKKQKIFTFHLMNLERTRVLSQKLLFSSIT